jgi:L-2-hydroxyglutarate oxidase
MPKKVAIIGGGILGLAIGYRLSSQHNKFEVHVFEKEPSVGSHQSGRNSGVLHCGLNYKPKSLKANLAFQGIREMVRFCEEHKVNFDRCGKVVVATNESEIPVLENLAERGKLNGLQGLRFLDSKELRKREPHVKGEKALLVPEEGIVDYKGVMQKMSFLIKDYGGEVHVNSKVNDIKKAKKGTAVLELNNTELAFDLVINCSGLHSDRVFKALTKEKRPLRIIPFRGEYMNIKEEYNDMVNHLVYPVPDPQYPFLGVHFTRMITGGREVGPNAVLALKREGYKNTDISFKDSFDSLFYSGFYHFIKNNFNFAMGEFYSSLSMKSFINKAQKMIPEIQEYMIEKGGAGVRAQAMSTKGELIMDFKIEKFDNQVHVLNAPSPGATASIAIANYIINNYIN